MSAKMELVSVMRINCWNTLPKDVVEFALQYSFQIMRGLSPPKNTHIYIKIYKYIIIINIYIREKGVCDIFSSRHIHPGEPCQMLRTGDHQTPAAHSCHSSALEGFAALKALYKRPGHGNRVLAASPGSPELPS